MNLKQYRYFRKHLKYNLNAMIDYYSSLEILHPEERYELNRDKALLYRLSNRGTIPIAFKEYMKTLIETNYGSWRQL